MRLHMSPSGVARLLYAILCENSGPLTPVLEELAGLEIRAEAPPGTRKGALWYRAGRLAAPGLHVADVTLELYLPGLPSGVLERLDAGEPCGTVLPGLRREDRRALAVAGHPGRDGIAVVSEAALELGGRAQGTAAERISTAYCEHAAAYLSGAGRTPWARSNGSTLASPPARQSDARRTSYAATR